MSPGGQPLASFTDRLLAYLIDYAIITGVMIILAIPAGVVFFVVVGPDLFEVQPDGTPATPDFLEFFVPLLLIDLAVIVATMVVAYLYEVEMMFRSGQTLGKRAMKIKVTPVDPAGALNRGMAARRWLVDRVAVMFLPGFLYVDGLWQLWDKPHQQCLHDKFAKTVVVKVPA
ncbi:RDD family protein [Phytohabitans rumicis]|uniref:RDD family protein n=1 Tax=Phytohabitans rumicis TaxID=1076125 RepID=A0A6V8LA19_9ACTN|nr:RDD family protein [Phytohabitans rumicis]GFJ90916.1 RDD family protein [Phytohabitans rumicis]